MPQWNIHNNPIRVEQYGGHRLPPPSFPPFPPALVRPFGLNFVIHQTRFYCFALCKSHVSSNTEKAYFDDKHFFSFSIVEFFLLSIFTLCVVRFGLRAPKWGVRAREVFILCGGAGHYLIHSSFSQLTTVAVVTNVGRLLTLLFSWPHVSILKFFKI